MNIVTKYPLTSFYTTVPVMEHSYIKPKLLEMIDAHPFDGTNPDISKVDWHSSMNFNRDWIQFIKPYLDNYNKIVGHATGYENPTITDLWFQQYIKNDKHEWHIHGQQMVGVYFLELPDDAPRTELISPFLQNEKFVVDVKEGDILVFPSIVVHKAPAVTGDRKTILSWNFHYEQPNPPTIEAINKL